MYILTIWYKRVGSQNSVLTLNEKSTVCGGIHSLAYVKIFILSCDDVTIYMFFTYPLDKSQVLDVNLHMYLNAKEQSQSVLK